jgi:hypothetical protein
MSYCCSSEIKGITVGMAFNLGRRSRFIHSFGQETLRKLPIGRQRRRWNSNKDGSWGDGWRG